MAGILKNSPRVTQSVLSRPGEREKNRKTVRFDLLKNHARSSNSNLPLSSSYQNFRMRGSSTKIGEICNELNDLELDLKLQLPFYPGSSPGPGRNLRQKILLKKTPSIPNFSVNLTKNWESTFQNDLNSIPESQKSLIRIRNQPVNFRNNSPQATQRKVSDCHDQGYDLLKPEPSQFEGLHSIGNYRNPPKRLSQRSHQPESLPSTDLQQVNHTRDCLTKREADDFFLVSYQTPDASKSTSSGFYPIQRPKTKSIGVISFPRPESTRQIENTSDKKSLSEMYNAKLHGCSYVAKRKRNPYQTVNFTQKGKSL